MNNVRCALVSNTLLAFH